MFRIPFVVALVAALALPVISQEAKPASSSPLVLAVSIPKVKVQIGDEIQVEATLTNSGDKDLDVTEFTYEERSLSFGVAAEFKGDGNPKKEYVLSQIRPDAQVMMRLPLARVTLGAKKSVNLIHRTPAIAVGKFTFTGRYGGVEGAAVSSAPVTVEVEATTSGSKLAAVVDMGDLGTFTILLSPEKSPANVTNYATLIKRGFYNDSLVHRIVKDSLIHAGCPYGLGLGGPGYAVRAELDKDLKHSRGTVSLSGFEKNGYTGSQFFICIGNMGGYDGKFTVIGQVDKDEMDKVAAISRKPADRNTDAPNPPIKIKTITLQAK